MPDRFRTPYGTKRKFAAGVSPRKAGPIWPSAGEEAQYRMLLMALVAEMNDDIKKTITRAYMENPPILAQDAMLSSVAIRIALRRLARRWAAHFDRAAARIAQYFASGVAGRGDASLRQMLKDMGFAVEFKLTDAQREALHSIIEENVALIRSIPREQLVRVTMAVMRAIQAGHDLATLTRELQSSFDVNEKRAALIARDQNAKAHGALQRVRFMELGINQAIWMHSGAGKHPRPTHVRAGAERVRYNVAEGWYDPHEQRHIFPGMLINCRCTAFPVIKGLSV